MKLKLKNEWKFATMKKRLVQSEGAWFLVESTWNAEHGDQYSSIQLVVCDKLNSYDTHHLIRSKVYETREDQKVTERGNNTDTCGQGEKLDTYHMNEVNNQSNK